MEKFKRLVDKSGKMFRKNYLEKHYPEYVEIIHKFIKDNNLIDLAFKQQVYQWLNNITEYQLCDCGNKVKFKNSTIGYYD